MVFLVKYRKRKNESGNAQELGHFALFLGISAMWYFKIMADYYTLPEVTLTFLNQPGVSLRYLFSLIGLISAAILIEVFTFLMEKRKVYFFKRYFFTLLFVITSCIAATLLLINIHFIVFTSFIVLPVFFLFFTVYLKDVVTKLRNEEKPVRKLVVHVPAFFAFMASFVLTMELVTDFIGLIFRAVGSVLQLISSIGISYFFLKIPYFSELDWKERLEHLFIMSKGGVCQLEEHFFHEKEETESMSEHLISSALASVNIMLKELTDSELEGLSVIKKRGKIVNIFSSKYVTGVIISSEEYDPIKVSLEKFVTQYEAIYKNVLENWDGNSEVFLPMKSLVKKMFSD